MFNTVGNTLLTVLGMCLAPPLACLGVWFGFKITGLLNPKEADE